MKTPSPATRLRAVAHKHGAIVEEDSPYRDMRVFQIVIARRNYVWRANECDTLRVDLPAEPGPEQEAAIADAIERMADGIEFEKI